MAVARGASWFQKQVVFFSSNQVQTETSLTYDGVWTQNGVCNVRLRLGPSVEKRDRVQSFSLNFHMVSQLGMGLHELFLLSVSEPVWRDLVLGFMHEVTTTVSCCVLLPFWVLKTPFHSNYPLPLALTKSFYLFLHSDPWTLKSFSYISHWGQSIPQCLILCSFDQCESLS